MLQIMMRRRGRSTNKSQANESKNKQPKRSLLLSSSSPVTCNNLIVITCALAAARHVTPKPWSRDRKHFHLAQHVPHRHQHKTVGVVGLLCKQHLIFHTSGTVAQFKSQFFFPVTRALSHSHWIDSCPPHQRYNFLRVLLKPIMKNMFAQAISSQSCKIVNME